MSKDTDRRLFNAVAQYYKAHVQEGKQIAERMEEAADRDTKDQLRIARHESSRWRKPWPQYLAGQMPERFAAKLEEICEELEHVGLPFRVMGGTAQQAWLTGGQSLTFDRPLASAFHRNCRDTDRRNAEVPCL